MMQNRAQCSLCEKQSRTPARKKDSNGVAPARWLARHMRIKHPGMEAVESKIEEVIVQ